MTSSKNGNQFIHCWGRNYNVVNAIDWRLSFSDFLDLPILLIVAIQTENNKWQAIEKPIKEEPTIGDLKFAAATGRKLNAEEAQKYFSYYKIEQYEN